MSVATNDRICPRRGSGRAIIGASSRLQSQQAPGRLQPRTRQPLAQSCWIVAGVRIVAGASFTEASLTEVSFTVAALATGMIVARLRATNAARMRYVIGFSLISRLVGRDVRLWWLHVGVCKPNDNAALRHLIYAHGGEMKI